MGIAQAVGEHLFQYFQSVLPLDGGKGGKRQLKPAAVENALQKFYAEARAERHRRRLGIIARARVALDLQRRLAGAGYPPQIVRQVVFSTLLAAFVGRAEPAK